MNKSIESLMTLRYSYSNISDRHRAQGLLRVAWGTLICSFIGMIALFTFRSRRPMFYVLDWPVGPTQIIYFAIFAISLVSVPIVLYFLNRGKQTLANRTYVALLFAIATLAYLSSNPTGFLMIAFTLPVIGAGVLLNQRDVITMVVLTASFLIAIVILAEMDLLGGLFSAEPTITEAATFGIIVVVVDSIIINVFAGRQHILLQRNFALTNDLEAAIAAEQEANRIRQQAEEEHVQLQQKVIDAQQQAIRDLSTPIIPVTDRVIVMPLVGNIDTARARDIMRALLAGISKHKATTVILDITGVQVIDGGVANHLNKTIQAARLKGARPIITGISAAVAETVVDLGIDWSNIETLRDLQSGLQAVQNHATHKGFKSK